MCILSTFYSSYLSLKKFFFLRYFWLHWVFVAARALSPVGVIRLWSSLWGVGFSCCRAQALGAGFSSCGA